LTTLSPFISVILDQSLVEVLYICKRLLSIDSCQDFYFVKSVHANV